MNRFPLPLRDKLRYRYGLRWASTIPTMAELRAWINDPVVRFVIAAALAYGVLGTLEYAEEQRQEALAQAESNRALTTVIANCLNGTAQFTTPGPHKDGHGHTGIVCRKAEEFRL